VERSLSPAEPRTQRSVRGSDMLSRGYHVDTGTEL